MRIGAFLVVPQFPEQTHSDVLERSVAAAVAAERSGFDEVWIAEHHFMSYGVCPAALTMAGYLLGATTTVTVGTAVSVLSTQHPVAVAEQAALLDHVSGGRFALGIGRGGPWIDLLVFGTGERRRDSDYAESLDVLLRGLRAGSVSGDGPAFRFPDVELVPRPRDDLPVIMAATSADGIALAADRGLPMLLGMDIDDSRKADVVRAWAERSGRHETDHIGAAHIGAALAYVADTTSEAQATMRELLPQWLKPGLASHRRADGAPFRPRDAHQYAQLLCELHPVGSPDDCVAALCHSARRTGLRRFMLMVEGAGDRARTVANISRLGAEVLPRVRAEFQDEVEVGVQAGTCCP